MKKVISIALAAAITAAIAGAAIAEDKTPIVVVDSAQIAFADQEPVILGEGYTVVPARGVFEAMGARVTWDGETRVVEVESKDHKTRVQLTIDNNIMKVYDLTDMFSTILSGQSFEAPETDVELDVAPQILSDRTMIPLRAISEAIDATVDWDPEYYVIDITTKHEDIDYSSIPTYYLSSDTTTVAKGDEINVFVNVENIPEGKIVSGVTATIDYDPDSFEFVDVALVNSDEVITNVIGASNAEFAPGQVKATYAVIDAADAVTEDGAVMKFTFKALTDDISSFSLSKAYDTEVGYNTYLQLAEADEETVLTKLQGLDIEINTNALIVNDGTEPEATEAPEATVEPEATAAPEATVDPEATAAPEATVDPEATAEPEETEAPAETAEPTAAPEA